ncbi:MAG: endonuclease/exonuclease/phosphatase family protein [Planctomycetota bacterium]|jgi:endonuclease/exonuclease/phosphatase family metal-dependent hydrolase
MRVITLNVRSFSGFAPGGPEPRAEDLPCRLAAELAAHAPDIIALQEAHDETRVAELAAHLRMAHVYFPGGRRYEGWRTGISGAIVTRYPVLESRNLAPGGRDATGDGLFSRCCGRVVLDSDCGELAAYCAHLHHIDPAIRQREIARVLDAVSRDTEAGLPGIVMGDLNHGPDSEEYRLWVVAGLRDCFDAQGTEPSMTWPSDVPRERIDYIWTFGPLSERLGACRVLSEGAFLARRGDPGSSALSDHLPVVAEFI